MSDVNADLGATRIPAMTHQQYLDLAAIMTPSHVANVLAHRDRLLWAVSKLMSVRMKDNLSQADYAAIATLRP